MDILSLGLEPFKTVSKDEVEKSQVSNLNICTITKLSFSVQLADGRVLLKVVWRRNRMYYYVVKAYAKNIQ